MDCTKHNSGCCKAEVGRGCTFCNCSSEPEAALCDGCFKLHETAWLEDYPDNAPTDLFEVRFKNTRRGFYQNANNLPLRRGDVVAVESSPGHDIGIISLTGDMVAKQMRRTGFNPQNGEFKKIYRKAKPYDIERWQESIALEHETMIAARQIAADMGLNMKIGDVEYQGDKIKAIFYYIADERVDFRELIKVFAERFHIRIEMKQIGARQEAGRIGGLGACGRELCCASWISSFTSVTTGAARTQDISLNPQKLAGQCSKLKCCLMYEYDTYVDARKDLPRLREPLQTLDGEFFLVKSDVLAGTMTFSSSKDSMSNLVTLPVARVREIISLNRSGKKVDRLQHADTVEVKAEEPTYRSEEDSITRFDQAKRRGGKNRRGKGGDERQGNRNAAPKDPQDRPAEAADGQSREQRAERRDNGRGRDNRNRQPQGNGQNDRRAEGGAPNRSERAPEGQGNANRENGGRDGNRENGGRDGNRRRNRGRGRGEGASSEARGDQQGTRPENRGEGNAEARPQNNREGRPNRENREGQSGNRNEQSANRGDRQNTREPRPENGENRSDRQNAREPRPENGENRGDRPRRNDGNRRRGNGNRQGGENRNAGEGNRSESNGNEGSRSDNNRNENRSGNEGGPKTE